jgi:hypothetical protein
MRHFTFIIFSVNSNKIVESVATFAREFDKYSDGWNAQVSAKIGVALCRGLVAFAESDYDEALRLMRPIRHDWNSLLGGSHAQKDILNQVLVHSAIKAGNRQVAKQLLQERLAFSAGSRQENEESCMNDRIMASIQAMI